MSEDSEKTLSLCVIHRLLPRPCFKVEAGDLLCHAHELCMLLFRKLYGGHGHVKAKQGQLTECKKQLGLGKRKAINDCSRGKQGFQRFLLGTPFPLLPKRIETIKRR